jgi:phage major head subunit gpT-like protein
MGLLGKSAIAQRAFTEGALTLNEAYGRILKGITPWGDWTMTVPTNTETVDFAYMLAVPRLAKTLGAVNYGDMKGAHYTRTMEPWSTGVRIHKDLLNDDNLGLIQGRMRNLAGAANRKVEELMFDLFVKGIATTTYGAGPDGVAFFATTHPIEGGTQSNYDAGHGSGPWYLLDCSDTDALPLILMMREEAEYTVFDGGDEYNDTGMVKVKLECRLQVGYGMHQKAYCSTQAIDEEQLWAAVTAMKGLVDDKGEKLGYNPTHLLCPLADERAAINAVKRAFIYDGAAATVSNEPITGMNLKVVASPWLT